jgi:hypothetical protein
MGPVYHSAGSASGGDGAGCPVALAAVVRDGAALGLPGVARVAVPDDGRARRTAVLDDVVV